MTEHSDFVTEPRREREIELTLSVVSHGHGALIPELLLSLEAHRPCMPLEVIVTLNIPEAVRLEELDLSFPVRIIENERPAGFGRNHNQAFEAARGRYFCVLNPDIIFTQDVLTSLIQDLVRERFGMVAPGITEADGTTGDNFRPIPTPRRILHRMLGSRRESDLLGVDERGYVYPDWIAGMFLVMRSDTFGSLSGFDERYHLYLEDVDLGVRCRLAGHPLGVNTGLRVAHHARRDSRRRLRFLLWHLSSFVKFYSSAAFWRTLAGGNRLGGPLRSGRLSRGGGG